MRFTKLKRLRCERGILQVELARQAGIERSRLSLIENGHVQPRADELQRLTAALGCSMSGLSEIPQAGIERSLPTADRD